MNKKGSHVGIVLSFTIFITALILVYAIVGPPVKIDSQKEMTVSLLYDKVLNEISTEIITIRLNGGSTSTCVIFDTPENDFSNPQVYSISISEEEIPSIMDSSDTKIKTTSGLVKVIYTDSSFLKGPDCDAGTCTALCEVKTISSLVKEKRILEKNILFIINQSIDNTTKLGNQLGISISDEYAILFDYMNGTRIGEDVRDDIKLNVYSELFEINYLDLNSKEKIGGLIIKIW